MKVIVLLSMDIDDILPNISQGDANKVQLDLAIANYAMLETLMEAQANVISQYSEKSYEETFKTLVDRVVKKKHDVRVRILNQYG